MMPDAHERRREFCARFKDERQRRDRSLVAIAAATKVQASLLEAFERGDVSRWPKGIYRRAFFRDYVTAIGLPVGQHVAEFVELFPDVDEPSVIVGSVPAPANGAGAGTTFRITLAEEASPWTMRAKDAAGFRLRAILQLAGAAAVDLLLVSGLAWLIAPWTGGLWSAIGMVGCVYFSLCTALLGRSLAATLLIRWTWAAAYGDTSRSAPAISLGSLSREMPDMRWLVAPLLRGHSMLKETLSRLPRASSNGSGQREADLAALRQRRVEAANRSSDEISEVLG
jgi:hypothetical protein